MSLKNKIEQAFSQIQEPKNEKFSISKIMYNILIIIKIFFYSILLLLIGGGIYYFSDTIKKIFERNSSKKVYKGKEDISKVIKTERKEVDKKPTSDHAKETFDDIKNDW